MLNQIASSFYLWTFVLFVVNMFVYWMESTTTEPMPKSFKFVQAIFGGTLILFPFVVFLHGMSRIWGFDLPL